MKKIIGAFLVSSLSSVAMAQEAPPVEPVPPQSIPECGPVDEMMTILAATFNEMPFVYGDDQFGTKMLIMLNPVSRTFTVLQVMNDGVACIALVGQNLAQIDKAQL